VCAAWGWAGQAPLDENLVALFADLHVTQDEKSPHQREGLSRCVQDVLACNPRPANVFFYGDLAYNHGDTNDYRLLKQLVKPLEDAGIRWNVSLGNHDRRAAFFSVFPERLVATPLVAERLVTVVKTPHADFILLDSCQEGQVSGAIDEAQRAWLQAALAQAKKPVFVGAHHPLKEIGLASLLLSSAACKGYLYGHKHMWEQQQESGVEMLCLPSSGHWGDIGFVLVKLSDSDAVFTLKQRDYYAPRPAVKPEDAKPEWRRRTEKNNGSQWRVSLAVVERPAYQTVKAEKIKAREGIGNVMKKIQAGQEVTVAYLGGSITAANGWRPKTTAWLQKTYPTAKFKEVNAAIGGTGSDLGVFRVGHDVLQFKPDLLFVEFAVNDGGAEPVNIWRCMEGIVRQTWKKDPLTDIVFAYTIAGNMTNDVVQGNCPRSASSMELLADFYGIPSVNFAVPVVELMTQGKLVFTASAKPQGESIWFSTDSVHPRDEGHELYLKLMAEALTQMQASLPVDHAAKLAKAFVSDNWESAKMVPLSEKMLTGNWKALPADDGRQRSFGERMGQVWMADQPGSKLHFKFKGSVAKVYDLLGPDGGQVTITVDGKAGAKPVPRFDSYCVYHRIATLGLVSDSALDHVHEVTVEIHPEQPDRKSVSFRLKDPAKELAEPKFQGTRVWMSQLMLLGDLAE
jgi:hypothetical protein